MANERRRYHRVRVNLVGRYMLADGVEYNCWVRDISPGGLAVMAPVSGRVGERVVAYINQIGRLEGAIIRTFSTGFGMLIKATDYGRDRISARVARVAEQQVLPEIVD